MAVSNRDRVGKSLELLRKGLYPFIEREMRTIYADDWLGEAREALGMDRHVAKKQQSKINWDSQAVLVLVWNKWNDVFSKTLGFSERSLVSELREVRNKWAHEENFTTREAARALDSIFLLLSAVSAGEAEEVDKDLQELNRLKYEDQARYVHKKASTALIEGTPLAGLKSWRMIVTPHPDVTEGKYNQAEFAADLAQVFRGGASSEYGDPVEFFRRTFLTDGLKDLLVQSLKRLTNKGGAPVLKLQTNFGGGKTHSLLGLYHLFSDVKPTDLPGIEGVLKTVGVSTVPKVKKAILVGTALSPSDPRQKNKDVTVNTLWGEMAWQLLGNEGYKLVAKSDKSGVSPGSDILVELFKKASPCMILIDEWVAFIKQLFNKKDELPAGSFDSNVTFAQTLTEAAKAVPGTLVVASLPASKIEVGGEYGRESLERLDQVFDRIDAPWRPATGEEGFEIVRRRLFQPITDSELQKEKDAVVRAFAEMYRIQRSEFPAECYEADYKRRMEMAYPIHPELFDRLFKDWSELDKFQLTRGVLRLMAEVVQTLWERADPNLMILPGMVPIDEPAVLEELRRYLPSVWDPVIESDVDGSHSLSLRLDNGTPNLGRLSACRRVTRTIYIGSAPTLGRATKGLEDKQIKLGCSQPGESIAIFSDALRRLSDEATYLYVDKKRFWFAPQPSVNRLASDRAAQFDIDTVNSEIKLFLNTAAAYRGDFASVHKCPGSSSDVPDEMEVRLVVLGPEYPHSAKQGETPAIKEANEILTNRGTSPRQYKNTLVFLVPDEKRLSELQSAVRDYLAWKSIESEKDELNLDAHQSKQAITKKEESKKTVTARIPETYCLILAPVQEEKMGKIGFQEVRLQTGGDNSLLEKVSKKLENEGLFVKKMGHVVLKTKALDEIPLWRGNHVKIKQLVEDYAKYVYLDRIKDSNVLLEAIREGLETLILNDETFAYAESYDEKNNRYLGLRHGRGGSVVINNDTVLVKPEIAQKQLDAESKERQEDKGKGKGATTEPPKKKGEEKVEAQERLTRFHGSVVLDASRLGRDAGQIGEAIITHMLAQIGCKANITMEIQVEIPTGATPEIIRTVTENCKTLKFKDFGFEKE